MTLSEDLNFVDQNGDFGTETSASTVLFGLTITPKVSGIFVGVLGLLAAVYMLLNLVMPNWEKYQQQQVKQNELQGQIDQKKASIKEIDKVKEELAQAKQQKAQVLGLFANEKTLDTLLLDMNRLVESGNARISFNAVRSKLNKFVPVNQKPEPITDGSLGLQINNKLKHSSINIEILGTYEQTQSILRNIERLQPLLIVKDYQSTLAPPEPTTSSEKVVRRIGPPAITTSFQLQALMPLSPEEIAAAAQAAPKK